MSHFGVAITLFVAVGQAARERTPTTENLTLVEDGGAVSCRNSRGKHFQCPMYSTCCGNGCASEGTDCCHHVDGSFLPCSEHHLVAFRYGNGVNAKKIREKFLDLKRTCKKNGKNVISEISGGPQSSPENVFQGYTDIFMVKFLSAADKDYYLGCIDKPCQDGGKKPAGGYCRSHDDFKVLVDPMLDGFSQVDNYNAGVIVHDYKPVGGNDLKGSFPHAVFFRFKQEVLPSVKAEVRSRFAALQYWCEGMKVFAAGDQNSKEGVHQNYEQGYWTVFDSQRNLDKYLGVNGQTICRAHADFKDFVGEHLLPDGVGSSDLANPDVIELIDSDQFYGGKFVFDFTELDRSKILLSGAGRVESNPDLASSLAVNLEQDLGEIPQLAAIQEVSGTSELASSLIDTVLEEDEIPEAAAIQEVSGTDVNSTTMSCRLDRKRCTQGQECCSRWCHNKKCRR